MFAPDGGLRAGKIEGERQKTRAERTQGRQATDGQRRESPSEAARGGGAGGGPVGGSESVTETPRGEKVASVRRMKCSSSVRVNHTPGGCRSEGRRHGKTHCSATEITEGSAVQEREINKEERKKEERDKQTEDRGRGSGLSAWSPAPRPE